MAVVGTIYSQELPNGDEYKIGDKTVRESVAEEFDSTATYADGDYCMYEGTLYKFNKSHTGDWVAADADAVQLVNEMKDAADASKADKVDLAPTFDTASAYSTGDLVIYENVLYKFTDDKTAGAWDSTKVATTNISQNINHSSGDDSYIVDVTSQVRSESGGSYRISFNLYGQYLNKYKKVQLTIHNTQYPHINLFDHIFVARKYDISMTTMNAGIEFDAITDQQVPSQSSSTTETNEAKASNMLYIYELDLNGNSDYIREFSLRFAIFERTPKCNGLNNLQYILSKKTISSDYKFELKFFN